MRCRFYNHATQKYLTNGDVKCETPEKKRNKKKKKQIDYEYDINMINISLVTSIDHLLIMIDFDYCDMFFVPLDYSIFDKNDDLIGTEIDPFPVKLNIVVVNDDVSLIIDDIDECIIYLFSKEEELMLETEEILGFHTLTHREHERGILALAVYEAKLLIAAEEEEKKFILAAEEEKLMLEAEEKEFLLAAEEKKFLLMLEAEEKEFMLAANVWWE